MDALKKIELEEFLKKLNQDPPNEHIFKTPDKKADDLPISYVENKLDELYFGLWGGEDFKTERIENEIVGSIKLLVFHPVMEFWQTRPGAASIQITVDAAPQNAQNKDRNVWAQDMRNKKPNALDMAYGKLKAECIKNAAKSLGKCFGRDLNRKEKKAEYTPQIMASDKTKLAVISRAIDDGNYKEARVLAAKMDFSAERLKDINARIDELEGTKAQS